MRVKPITSLATVLRNVTATEVDLRNLCSIEGSEYPELFDISGFESFKEARRIALPEIDRSNPYITTDLHCVLHQIANSHKDANLRSIELDFKNPDAHMFDVTIASFAKQVLGSDSASVHLRQPVTLIATHGDNYQSLFSSKLPNSRNSRPLPPAAHSGSLETVCGIRICTDHSVPDNLRYMSKYVSKAFTEDAVCWHDGKLYVDPKRMFLITHPIR